MGQEREPPESFEILCLGGGGGGERLYLQLQQSVTKSYPTSLHLELEKLMATGSRQFLYQLLTSTFMSDGHKVFLRAFG